MQYIKEIEVIKSNTLKTDEEIVKDILMLLSYHIKEQEFERFSINKNKFSFENLLPLYTRGLHSHMKIVKKGEFDLTWKNETTLLLKYQFKLRFFNVFPLITLLVVLILVTVYQQDLIYLMYLFAYVFFVILILIFSGCYYMLKRLNHYHYFKNKLPFKYVIEGDIVTPLYF